MNLPANECWTERYAEAYSYGHNKRNLHGKRLDHFACAYADICDRVGEMSVTGFFALWDGGAIFYGTAGEHWRVEPAPSWWEAPAA